RSHCHSFPTRRSSDLGADVKVTPSQFAKLDPAVVSVFGIAAVTGTASYSWTAITFVLLAATSAVQRIWWSVAVENVPLGAALRSDRKSTRLNSSHLGI